MVGKSCVSRITQMIQQFAERLSYANHNLSLKQGPNVQSCTSSQSQNALARRPVFVTACLSALFLLLGSCAELRPEGVVPGSRDWAKVLPVNPADGIYFDVQTGSLFQQRDFFLYPPEGFCEGLRVVEPRLENEPQFPQRKKGYIDRAGRLVIPFRYDYANGFCDGRATVTIGKSHGIIDRTGRWIVEPGKYDKLGVYTEGLCAFCKGDHWGFLDTDGNVVIPPLYKEAGAFSEGLCVVQDVFDNWVYIDHGGRVRIRLPNPNWKGYYTTPEDPDWRACYFSEGLARVEVYISPPVPNVDGADWRMLPHGYLTGYISKDGRMAIEPRFGTAGDFSEGLAPVTMTKDSPVVSGGELISFWTPKPEEPEPPPAWGFINKKGEVVIPLVYEKALHFRDGLAPVRQGGKWGYIDRQGRMVIGAGFERAEEFENGVAEVALDGGVAYIDKQGRLLVRTEIGGTQF